MKRLVFLLLSFVAMLGILTACNKEYRQDLTPYELADYVERGLSLEALRNLDDKADFYGELLPPENDTTFSLRVAEDGSKLDEFGVFACADETSAKEFAKELEGYLEKMDQANREWYLSYIPEEVPKLQNAEVKSFGRYVAYAILNENERNRVFDLLREKLLR